MAARNPTLDIAKGLGIGLVVLGHSGFALADKGWLFRVIFSFHMPLFFVLAGAFVRRETAFGPFLRSRAHTLLKPYAVVLTLWGTWNLVEGWFLYRGAHPVHVGFLLGIPYGTGQSLAPWTPLWFLPHLVLASAALLAVLKVTSTRIQWLLVPALLMGGAALLPLAARPLPFALPGQGLMVGLPWSLDLLPLTLPMLLAGHLLSDRIQAVRFRPLPFLFSVTVFAGLHLTFRQTLDLSGRTCGTLPVAALQAVTGIHLCLSLSALLGRWKPAAGVLGTAGAGSLFILVFHGWCHGQAYYRLRLLGLSATPAEGLALAAGLLGPLGIWALAQRFRALAALLLPPARRNPPFPVPGRPAVPEARSTP